MTLKIFLLGQFKLQANDITFELPSRPAQSLLAYLALNAGVTQRREKLAGLLWPEAPEANARSYLRQALWRIRKSLEGASLNPEDYLKLSEIEVFFDQTAELLPRRRSGLEKSRPPISGPVDPESQYVPGRAASGVL